jgi:hypothetical protein
MQTREEYYKWRLSLDKNFKIPSLEEQQQEDEQAFNERMERQRPKQEERNYIPDVPAIIHIV